MDLQEAHKLDSEDQLAKYRSYFFIEDPELIYLDGNSLGRLPKKTIEKVNHVLKQEWGSNLIQSWDSWLPIAKRIGDKIGKHLLGTNEGEVIISDNVTTNIYKILSSCVDNRKTILITNKNNFPTDKYVLQRITQRLKSYGKEIEQIFFENNPISGPSIEDIAKVLHDVDGTKAIFLLSHVDYKSGALADMQKINKTVHKNNALIIWDLCHSVGAVPIQLKKCNTDFAVGCTYKYLNGGPGSPSFIYINKKQLDNFASPIGGWFSQKDQFSFNHDYEPHPQIDKSNTGTPPIISISSIEPAVDIFIEAGIDNIRKKSIKQTDITIKLIKEHLSDFNFSIQTPENHEQRGSHVSISHEKAFEISLALRDKKVIPDFRHPNVIRLGIAPLYTTYVDIYNFISRLKEIMQNKLYENYAGRNTLVP